MYSVEKHQQLLQVAPWMDPPSHVSKVSGGVMPFTIFGSEATSAVKVVSEVIESLFLPFLLLPMAAIHFRNLSCWYNTCH